MAVLLLYHVSIVLLKFEKYCTCSHILYFESKAIVLRRYCRKDKRFTAVRTLRYGQIRPLLENEKFVFYKSATMVVRGIRFWVQPP